MLKTEERLTGEPMLVRMVVISPFANTMPSGVVLRTFMGEVIQSEVLLIMKLRSYLPYESRESHRRSE